MTAGCVTQATLTTGDPRLDRELRAATMKPADLAELVTALGRLRVAYDRAYGRLAMCDAAHLSLMVEGHLRYLVRFTETVTKDLEAVAKRHKRLGILQGEIPEDPTPGGSAE